MLTVLVGTVDAVLCEGAVLAVAECLVVEVDVHQDAMWAADDDGSVHHVVLDPVGDTVEGQPCLTLDTTDEVLDALSHCLLLEWCPHNWTPHEKNVLA